jgi:hypothetical protein
MIWRTQSLDQRRKTAQLGFIQSAIRRDPSVDTPPNPAAAGEQARRNAAIDMQPAIGGQPPPASTTRPPPRSIRRAAGRWRRMKMLETRKTAAKETSVKFPGKPSGACTLGPAISSGRHCSKKPDAFKFLVFHDTGF